MSSDEALTLTVAERDQLRDIITGTLADIEHLRQAMPLRYYYIFKERSEGLRKALSLIDSQGSQALPDPEEKH